MIAPLSSKLWFQSISELEKRIVRDRCTGEQAVRHLFHLAQIAPGKLNEIFSVDLTDKQFEKALRKYGARTMLERLVNRENFAIFVQPDVASQHPIIRDKERSNYTGCSSDDELTALLLAWLKAFQAMQPLPVSPATD